MLYGLDLFSGIGGNTFLFLENVPAIRTRGLDRVVEELTVRLAFMKNFSEAINQAIDEFNQRTERAIENWAELYGVSELLIISDKPLQMTGVDPLPICEMIDGGLLGKRYIVLKKDLEKYVTDQ